MTGLRETIEALGARVVGLGAEDQRIVSLIEEASGKLDATSVRIQEVASEIARAHEGLLPVAALTQEVAAQRKAMELPLIGMTQLRMALNMETPYRTELTLAKQLVASDNEAVVALSAVLPVAQCEGALTDPASAPMAPRDTSYAFPLLWRGSYLRSQRRRNAKQSAEQ